MKGGVFLYCFKCGRLIDNDSRFCEFCGARFEDNQRNNNNKIYGTPSYGQNNQFINQPNNNVNRGFNAGSYPDMNMQNNVNQSPYNNYQVPPVQPMQSQVNPSGQNFQQPNNEMDEIYHKYMDDQYAAVDPNGNKIMAANTSNVQGIGNPGQEQEYSKNFKIIAIVLSIFGLFSCGTSFAELIVGIVFCVKGRKKEGSLLIGLYIAIFILRVILQIILGSL